MTAAATKASSGRKKGAVFMGDNFIELDDPSTVTLEDLCESFGTPWESGMHVRQRTTGRVVATLPFEPLPPLSEVADVMVKMEETSTAAPATPLDLSALRAEDNNSAKANKEVSCETNNNDEDDEEEEEDEGSAYAIVYDLVNSNAPEMDETVTSLASPMVANIRGIPGIEETMRQLVELGAADLLMAEPLSVVDGKREYNPVEAPGLLRRIVYPASQYSPYRTERDPVSDGRHVLFRSATGSTSSPTSAAVAPYQTSSFIGEGGPYTSYLDSYAFGEQGVELPCMAVTSSRKAALVVPLTNEEQQKIFGF